MGITHTLKKLVHTPQVIGIPTARAGLPFVVDKAVDIVQGLLKAIVYQLDLRWDRILVTTFSTVSVIEANYIINTRTASNETR